MISIAYVSSATTTITEADITAILVQSRANNVLIGLTGALLFHEGRFIQILEGPVEQVRARIAVIEADPRHRNVQVLRETAIARRQFPNWTMGFRSLTGSAARRLPGFDDFFDGHTGKARLEHANDPTHQFLEWLAEYWFSPA